METAPKGVPITQWEKDGCEDAGLVKIDLLGNRSLGVIRDALTMVRENVPSFDETRWEPEDDGPTQAAVARGATMGCFYIESPAMRLLQKKAGVGDFEHLVIHSSIIRPAANDYIQEYLARLKGAPWQPIHPLLADALDETFGIMVYQEDVSRAAVALAGFSHAEADRLRKVMSKKDKELDLKAFREHFFEGARNRGVADDQIEAVWNMMLSFSGYSFCKPPQRQLRPGLISGRVPQDPLSGRIHGRRDRQPGRVLQRLCLCVRSPASGLGHPAPGREPKPHPLDRRRQSFARRTDVHKRPVR